MTCAHVHRVDAHFRGRLALGDELALRHHLPECDVCTARYERHLLFERLSPHHPSPQQRLARALGLRSQRRWRFVLPLAGLTFASTAAVLLLLWLRPPTAPEFGPRGGALPATAVTTELHIFRVAQSGRPEAVAGSIFANDELGFGYRNPLGKQRLLVFARDAHDHFYWYHPAWTCAAEDPVATPILGGPESRELSDVVAHDLDADRIVLFALFTDEPLAVRSVEALARRQPLDQLVLPGALVIATPLRVKR